MARSRLYPPSVDPGFPKLPPLPNGWARTTFGKVLEVVERPASLVPNQFYRLVNAKRNRGGIVLRDELLGQEVLTKTQFEARAGDFLISRRQIIHGACGVVPAELDGAVVSNEYSTLRTRQALLMDFLKHYCHTPYFQRTCFHSSHGVDVEKMIFKIDEWLVREVDVPPIPEQRKIGTILSSVDEAMESTQAIIEQLQVVKKATMDELLTRGIPGWHTKFKTTEIGEVPEGWEVTRIVDVADVDYGISAAVSKNTDPAIGWPIITGANITLSGGLNLSTVVYHPKPRSQQHCLKRGDLLLNWRSGSAAHVGKTALFDRDDDITYASFVLRVRTRGQLLPRFGHAQLNWMREREYFSRDLSQQVNFKMNAAVFRDVLIRVPSMAEQIAIADAAQSLDAALSVNNDTLTGLRSVKASLMSVLLTGEVRVHADEDAA